MDVTLFTIDEAAAQLRVSRWSVYNLIRSGQLQTIKIGRRRLVPRCPDRMPRTPEGVGCLMTSTATAAPGKPQDRNNPAPNGASPAAVRERTAKGRSTSARTADTKAPHSSRPRLGPLNGSGGRSDIEVTMTIYAHTSLDEKRRALGKLGEALA